MRVASLFSLSLLLLVWALPVQAQDELDDLDGPAEPEEEPRDKDRDDDKDDAPDPFDELPEDEIPETLDELEEKKKAEDKPDAGERRSFRSSMSDPSKAVGELPPEPPADGVAGAWYLVEVSCRECSSILEQDVVLDAPMEIIRAFNEQFIVAPDKVSGSYGEPAAERRADVKVIKGKGQQYTFVVFTKGQGIRVTDRFAQVWQFELLAEDKVLFGRYYQVTALSEGLWEDNETGYRAKSEDLTAEQLAGLIGLPMVEGLNKDDPFYKIGETARVEYNRQLAAIRSDFSAEALDAYKAKLTAEIEAREARKAEIEELLRTVRRAQDDKDWAKCARTLIRVHELGFENDDTHYNLGKCYERAGDNENAAVEYNRVLEEMPRDVITLFRLAAVYEKLERYQDAMELYNRIKKASREGSKDWTDAHYRRLELLEKVYSQDK